MCAPRPQQIWVATSYGRVGGRPRLKPFGAADTLHPVRIACSLLSEHQKPTTPPTMLHLVRAIGGGSGTTHPPAVRTNVPALVVRVTRLPDGLSGSPDRSVGVVGGR